MTFKKIGDADHQAEIAKIERGLGTRQERQTAMIDQFRTANQEAAAAAFAQGHPILALSVAPPWMPAPGTIIEGTVFGIIPRAHPTFGTYPIVGLKLDDGTFLAVHGLPQTLHDGLRAVAPQVPDRIAIAFIGERLSSSRGADDDPTMYRLYAVTSPSKAVEVYAW